MTSTIYQILSNNQLQADKGAVAWNNRLAIDSLLREYPVFKRIAKVTSSKLWGAVSPRFSVKTNISVKTFSNWINTNPGYDIYFINPCSIMCGLFENVWIQGEQHHPGLINLANSLLLAAGYKVQVETLLMDHTTFAFCNYFVATKEFWQGYFNFVDSILLVADQQVELYDQLYNNSANYTRDHTLSYYPFLVERLLSTYLCLFPTWRKLSYSFTQEELANKVNQQQFLLLQNLKQIKHAAASLCGRVQNCQNLFDWQQQRQKFYNQNPHLYFKE